MGYNGAPPGLQHCLSVGCNIVKGNCVRVTHAEQNAIAFAARTGVATEHATLYTTYAPCRSCSHSLIAAGIAAVVYVKDYHDDGLDILHDAAITVNRYKYSQAKLG
jgi:dCMP deaminase